VQALHLEACASHWEGCDSPHLHLQSESVYATGGARKSENPCPFLLEEIDAAADH